MSYDPQLKEYEEEVNSLGWGNLLAWGVGGQSNSWRWNPYLEGLTITDDYVNNLLKGEFIDFFVVGSADPRKNTVLNVHMGLTSAVAPNARKLFGHRNFNNEPLTKNEFTSLLKAVKSYWNTKFGGDATDEQIATIMVLDEILTRWYRRADDAAVARIFELTLEQVKAGYTLQAAVFYANISYSRLRDGKEMTRSAKKRFSPSLEQIESSYLSHSILSELGVVGLPHELVQQMIRGKAFPELELVTASYR